MIDKNCCNRNVFIQMFTLIMDTLKKLQRVRYNIKQVSMKWQTNFYL